MYYLNRSATELRRVLQASGACHSLCVRAWRRVFLIGVRTDLRSAHTWPDTIDGEFSRDALIENRWIMGHYWTSPAWRRPSCLRAWKGTSKNLRSYASREETLADHLIRFDDNSLRYLTVRESARIQRFPDDYEFPVARSRSIGAIGNAVPIAELRASRHRNHVRL